MTFILENLYLQMMSGPGDGGSGGGVGPDSEGDASNGSPGGTSSGGTDAGPGASGHGDGPGGLTGHGDAADSPADGIGVDGLGANMQAVRDSSGQAVSDASGNTVGATDNSGIDGVAVLQSLQLQQAPPDVMNAARQAISQANTDADIQGLLGIASVGNSLASIAGLPSIPGMSIAKSMANLPSVAGFNNAEVQAANSVTGNPAGANDGTPAGQQGGGEPLDPSIIDRKRLEALGYGPTPNVPGAQQGGLFTGYKHPSLINPYLKQRGNA